MARSAMLKNYPERKLKKKFKDTTTHRVTPTI